MAEVYIKSEMFLFDRVLNNKRQFNIPEDDNIVETVHITWNSKIYLHLGEEDDATVITFP